MAINFPNSPAVNDTFTVGGIKFTFTGVKWESGAVVELSSDITPTLGGNLDGSAKNINNVGVITATGFSGPLTGAVTGNVNGNATGLTGDPSIQVTNATVLGNLDVQGTTTTIDTAVTEVDSLAVEGSVGIGTTNPGAKLEIRDDSSTGIIIRSNSTQATDTNKALRVRNNSDTNTFHVSHKGQGYFAGHLGIGTVSPSGPVHAHTASGTQRSYLEASASHSFLRLKSGSTSFNTGVEFFSGSSNIANINGLGAGDLQFEVNGSEKLRIDSAGMVGINMTPSTTGNSTYMLQMYNAGSQCFMSLGQGSGNGPLNGLVVGVSNAAHYITGRENLPMIFATNDTERLRITSAGTLQIGSSATINVQISPNTGLVINDGAIDCYQATSNSAAIPFKIQSDVGGTKVVKASITAGGVISDSIGPLRRLGVAAHSTNYTLQTSDAGKLLRDSAGSQFTIPPHPELAAGDMISIFNVSGSNMQVLQGSGVTLYNSADAATGTRTLAPKGMCTIVCTASNEFVISGTQLT